MSNADQLYAEVVRLQEEFIAQAHRLQTLRQNRRLAANDDAAYAAEQRLGEIQAEWRAALERLRAALDNDDHI